MGSVTEARLLGWWDPLQDAGATTGKPALAGVNISARGEREGVRRIAHPEPWIC
jgi:hypothetical protein